MLYPRNVNKLCELIYAVIYAFQCIPAAFTNYGDELCGFLLVITGLTLLIFALNFNTYFAFCSAMGEKRMRISKNDCLLSQIIYLGNHFLVRSFNPNAQYHDHQLVFPLYIMFKSVLWASKLGKHSFRFLLRENVII